MATLTFNLIVAYATLGIILLIGLPLFIIGVMKFYKNYNERYFIVRHRILIVISTIFFSSFLLIEQPFYQILIISHNGDLERVPKTYILYTSFFKCCYYGNAIIYSLRVWFLYFDGKYHDDLKKYQWQIVLNEKYTKEIQSWFIKNRSIFGSPPILYKGAIILWLIISLIHINIQLLTMNTQYFYIAIWSFLLFVLALFVIFMIILWRKFPRNDEFCIKKELKLFLTSYIIISIIAISVILIIILIRSSTDINDKEINISFLMFLFVVIMNIVGIYTNTLGTIRLMNKKNIEIQLQQENDGVYVKQLFQQFETLTLENILSNTRGFEAFMNHLTNEFSSENLLFTVEVLFFFCFYIFLTLFFFVSICYFFVTII